MDLRLEHASVAVLALELLLCGLILGRIFAARAGRVPFIRRIPGLAAIDEGVGRATEMGRPILFSLGLGGLDIVTLQALAVLGHVARVAARYASRVIVPVRDAVIFSVTEEVLRDAYTAEGKPELFQPDDVRFLSDRQFAYASGVMGIINRERTASSFLFGTFYAESLILAEAGHQVGALQVAGTPSTTQIPFFIAACDYTIIGEEYYAASAYLTQEPTFLGSLIGQDWSKIVLLSILVVMVLAATLWSLTHGGAMGDFEQGVKTFWEWFPGRAAAGQ
ncbi:MAG: hypothetical protein HY321_07800 [Armatimonadetes bacterium]|nr:hypothetical protein [Armatimonadota bacterium]